MRKQCNRHAQDAQQRKEGIKEERNGREKDLAQFVD
jgi:hypothetical protein